LLAVAIGERPKEKLREGVLRNGSACRQRQRERQNRFPLE
jgi:hypothetical protein